MPFKSRFFTDGLDAASKSIKIILSIFAIVLNIHFTCNANSNKLEKFFEINAFLKKRERERTIPIIQ